QPAAGFVGREPGDPIDLRERLAPATAGRPFHLELVRDRSRRIQVALDCPGMDDLAALLDDRPELDRRRAVGLAHRRCQAYFLEELAPRDGEEIVLGCVRLALRDRPVPLVATGEERTAGMAEEHLDRV